jgi:anti-anti-sigma regulatory factor
LRCSGDEDRATQPFRRPALARAIKAQGDVAVELAELEWADASLLLDLVMLARRLRAEGRTLVLRDPQAPVAALLALGRLDRMPAVRVERSREPVLA